MDIAALVVYLLHYKILRLYTVHPIRDCVGVIMVAVSGGGVDDQDSGCFRKTEQPAIFIGGKDPVRDAVVVQLKGIIRQTFEQSAAKEPDMAV